MLKVQFLEIINDYKKRHPLMDNVSEEMHALMNIVSTGKLDTDDDDALPPDALVLIANIIANHQSQDAWTIDAIVRLRSLLTETPAQPPRSVVRREKLLKSEFVDLMSLLVAKHASMNNSIESFAMRRLIRLLNSDVIRDLEDDAELPSPLINMIRKNLAATKEEVLDEITDETRAALLQWLAEDAPIIKEPLVNPACLSLMRGRVSQLSIVDSTNARQVLEDAVIVYILAPHLDRSTVRRLAMTSKSIGMQPHLRKSIMN